MTETEWNGFKRLDFVLDGRHALLIVPHQPAPGNPWVWRAEWFGNQHGPEVQLALLERGWHVGYMNAKDMYGGPRAIELFDSYYKFVTSVHSLSARMVIEGFSRGGLYAVNFAATYPDRVAGLYLDAPALDIRSWPGEDHSGWADCLSSYGIDNNPASIEQVNPINKTRELVDANIPVIGVSGDIDKIVPYVDNLAVLKETYITHGGVIDVIIKPGAGHSPHSLTDPTPIVDFVLKNMRE